MALPTWDSELAADHGHDLRMYFTIEGIPYLFHESDGFPSALGLAGATSLGLIRADGGIDQSESRLNPATRRMEGGSLTLRLQDDDDGTLAALFAPRRYRDSFVSSSVGAAGDITVKGVGNLDAAGVVYIDGETVSYTSIVGTTLTGCTRGAFGSKAEEHIGLATDGAPVFTAPASWEGRRVFLFGYFVSRSESSSGRDLYHLSTAEQLGTFRLQKAPQHDGDDGWTLSCGDLIEEFANKKLGGGFQDVDVGGATTTVNASGNVELVVGEGANFNQFVTGDYATWVKVILASGSPGWAPLLSQVSTDTIEMLPRRGVRGDREVSQVRHVALLTNVVGVLYGLLSRLGDGTNGTYDVLPGFTPTNFGPVGATRLGAGLAEADVDVDSFLALARSVRWDYFIDEEISVEDFLFDFCLPSDCAFLVTRAGALKVIPLAEDGTTAVMTVDDDLCADSDALVMEYDESQIYPRVSLEMNYEPLTKQYLVRENFFDAALQKRYPNNEKRLDLRSRSIVMRAAEQFVPQLRDGGLNPEQIGGMLRRIQAAEGRGRAFVKGAFHLPLLKAQLGDIVTLNNLTVPDAEGATTLTSRPARIVAMRPRYDDAVVDVTFQLLDKLWRLAPGCTIASRAGAVLTLNTADIGIRDAHPGRMFADTGVVVVDVNTGTRHQANVIAHTDTTITLDAAPAFANEANKDFVKLDSQTNGSGAASENGFVDSDFLYEMPDDENDGTAVEVTRWR